MDLPVITSDRKQTILRMLTERPATIRDISGRLGVTRSVAWYHMRGLLDAGLVAASDDWRKVFTRTEKPCIVSTDDGGKVDSGLTHGVTVREGDGQLSSSSSSSRQVSTTNA